jgi:Ca2+-binding RTX toxin-like protein
MKRRIVALFLTASASVAMFASPALATNYTIVSGTSADDRIVMGPQPQEIRGKGGDDFLAGGKSPDILRGGPGDDKIWTGLGGVPDEAYGGPGDDRLHNHDSGQAGQLLDGGPGIDICTGDKHDTFISCEVVMFG